MRVYTTNQNRGSCLCKGAVLEREREREREREFEERRESCKTREINKSL